MSKHPAGGNATNQLKIVAIPVVLAGNRAAFIFSINAR
jgi:hypothetical protein